MIRSSLDMFMELKAIDPNFVDAWGKPAVVSEENIKNLINKMGHDTSDETQLQNHYHEQERLHWLSLLPPVTVAQQADSYIIDICLPIDFVTDALIYQITTEDKKQIKQNIVATDFDLVAVNEISEIEFQCYQVALKVDLPQGYHLLEVFEKGNEEALTSMSFIITPSACFTPKAMQEGKKIWGSSVQLYCIKSENNWGIGDFSDLKVLLQKTADHGGDFIGLNPIHALFPAQPNNASPYSPSSRKWLNVLYTDLTNVAEFKSDQALQSTVNSPEFNDKLSSLRDSQWVDYQGVTELKLAILRTLFSTLNKGDKNTEKRLSAFNEYVALKGDALLQQAAYDALQFKFLAEDESLWGWPVWPEAFHAYQSEASQTWIEDNKQEVLFWCYCQWVTELQLEEADQLAKSLGMTLGIYRDLAVGVGKGSSEIWANHSVYCEEISVGAPPDILGPLGQSWGLPPMSPDQLYKSAYQPFIELLQSNMSHCGALRIDHVMALLRLWWVPDNATAEAGAYIYYPVQDLLNLLALESQRNQCLVIGEDLGTVPEGIDVLLEEAGVYSYKVFFFEQADDGGYISPAHYKNQAMAALSTHDMPTIKGYWHCDDLYLGKELGLYPDAEALAVLMENRVYCKQQILNSLHGHDSLPVAYNRDATQTGMDQTLNFALQTHLAKGTSALLSLQLEDFLEMEVPVNVPGTSDEYRNWQRKLSHNIEQIFDNEQIKTLLDNLTTARNEAVK
ncbi:4-alpha-glucanotransferase [Psychromonas sp. Urea-02u-13]|uniref:4-alpha-glucanotransferase n=1 Tax=Psychromonas sp. Urea-02u-13 TaxID=2058326 RepID=UPI000C32D62E|nr:4-alpha-glucanotransferase [Psychromonas sp. Urea-02u-13]PKG40248.1 4-alpha-glucanotransferase [Psychromonas sp. Urea-02u-13]